MSKKINDTLHIRVEYFTGLEEDDGEGQSYYVASSDAIGLVTEGETFEELLSNLKEVLSLCLEDGNPIKQFNLVPNPRVILHRKL